MIIDVHTHGFPPSIRERRDEYLARDTTFLRHPSSFRRRTKDLVPLSSVPAESQQGLPLVIVFPTRPLP